MAWPGQLHHFNRVISGTDVNLVSHLEVEILGGAWKLVTVNILTELFLNDRKQNDGAKPEQSMLVQHY